MHKELIEELRKQYKETRNRIKKELEEERKENLKLSKIAIAEFRKHIIEDKNHKFELISSYNAADTCRDPDDIHTSKQIFKTLDDCLKSITSSTLQAWRYNEEDNTLTNYECCSYGSDFIIKNIVCK